MFDCKVLGFVWSTGNGDERIVNDFNDLHKNLIQCYLCEILGFVALVLSFRCYVLRCLQGIPPKTRKQRSKAAQSALQQAHTASLNEL
jgi:hypothetical protein